MPAASIGIHWRLLINRIMAHSPSGNTPGKSITRQKASQKSVFQQGSTGLMCLAPALAGAVPHFASRLHGMHGKAV
ncbi:MAG: hypothetical protein DWH82_06660 [Planctomycetota bacterium]|nr:MAG: hypothetical protein DWH82_06660 [Planctomycetota bacterium]